MKIIKSTDAITVDHPVFLVFGQPGIGKTSLGYSGKNALLLDADQGAHRAINRRDTVQVTSWKDIAELAESASDLAPYDTLVLDTVGRVLDHLAVALMDETPKFDRGGGSLSLQGFGALKARFQAWLMRVRSLGKDVVMLAHAKEDKDGDSLIVRPDVTGGSYAEIMKVADFVGFLYMRNKDRVLDFSPSDRWVGKNPAQWKPIVLPAPEKATTVMATLFDKGREALGAISDESASLIRQVEEWRARIDAITTAPHANTALPEINKLPPMAIAQVKALLQARTKALGITFDTKLRAFLDPPKKVEAPAAEEIFAGAGAGEAAHDLGF